MGTFFDTFHTFVIFKITYKACFKKFFVPGKPYKPANGPFIKTLQNWQVTKKTLQNCPKPENPTKVGLANAKYTGLFYCTDINI